jgi:hypothetical protein
MSVKRRQLGIVLICISVFAAIAYEIAGSHSRIVASGSEGNAYCAVGSVELAFSWRYFIPVILCAAIGLFCLAWPSRKPPKLSGRGGPVWA